MICDACQAKMDCIQNTIFICPKCDNKKYVDGSDFLSRSKSFLGAAARHVQNGMASVSAAQKESRMSICRACEFFNNAKVTCSRCGCYLNIKTKWASESCPEGKWTSEKLSKASGKCGGCGRKKT